MNIPAILYNNADFDSILGAEIIERYYKEIIEKYYKEKNLDIPSEKQLKFIMSNLSLDDYKKIVKDYDVIIIIGISKIYNIFNEVFNIIKDKDYYIFECNPMFTNYLKKKKLDNKQIFVKTDESKALQVFNLIKNPLKFINFNTTYSKLKYFSDGYTCNYEMDEDSNLTDISPEDCLREKYYYLYNKQDETVASYFTSYYLYGNEENLAYLTDLENTNFNIEETLQNSLCKTKYGVSLNTDADLPIFNLLKNNREDCLSKFNNAHRISVYHKDADGFGNITSFFIPKTKDDYKIKNSYELWSEGLSDTSNVIKYCIELNDNSYIIRKSYENENNHEPCWMIETSKNQFDKLTYDNFEQLPIYSVDYKNIDNYNLFSSKDYFLGCNTVGNKFVSKSKIDNVKYLKLLNNKIV